METKSQARIAEARICCAEAALLSGNVEKAIRLTLASMAELRELGQPINLINALTNMSAAHAISGDLDSARAAALQAIRSPWQLEGAVSLFDQIGWLAARLGFHSQAGLILGFADRGYAVTQDARHTLAAREEREAVMLIEGAVGAAEHSRLRALGADLKEAQAEALAKEVLEAS